MANPITDASSFIGARGHLAQVAEPVRRAAAKAAAARAAFESSESFKLATPERQREALKEREAAWLAPVEEATAGALETIANARTWVPELETFAKSEPLPSEKDLQRATLLRPFVDEDVAELRLPSEVARLVDVARIEGDVGRMYALVRAIRRKMRDPAHGRQGFTSPELKVALDKATYVLTQPGAKDRARAAELAVELSHAASAAQIRVREAQTEAAGAAAKAGQSRLYASF